MAYDVEADPPLLSPTRRAVLATAGAAAVVVLTGCSTYDSSGGSGPAAGSGGDSGADSGGEQPPAPSGGAPQPIAKAADVPVGGGVVTEKGVVVTQPTAGQFLGFTSVCTHQGCTVSGVDKGLINCACHGSQFKIADGSVAAGPANRPLRKIDISVTGGEIFRLGGSS
jgi:Rieske Fe-S protein